MKDIVYVSDTNTMGTMKFKWIKWFVESLVPDAVVRQAFTPEEVFNVNDSEYVVTFEDGTTEGIPNGKSNELFNNSSINPDAIICDDLTRANPGCTKKIYDRSIIFYEAISRGIQTHVIAPDITMSYAGGLELARKVKLPYSKINDFSNVHVWYGINEEGRYKEVSMWNKIWKNMPNSVPELNLITGICYAYLKFNRDKIRSNLKFPEGDNYGYYGFWRRGMLLDNVMSQPELDTVIGSFKWRPHCEATGRTWINGNKTLEEIFSVITKSYIPSEGIKNDIQHIFRQFEGLVYARDGVEYDTNYPEHMKVYSLDDPKLFETYSPILNRLINLIKSV